ncbi:MupA/Atu3671 family FMN-dependent luciferase-like monooxygenase [Spongiactinospora sp. 9N601]|uniref:MupA/Atu3671 family FMN-dependent luciferase-like monooxygenase n=1 Tax=Spongiactinospora sp. 9N601 TaxID=3375149 RepID=UPI0037B28CB7
MSGQPSAGLTGERRRLLERLLERRGPGQAGDDEHDGLKVSLFFFSAALDDRVEERYEVVLDCAEQADQLGLHAIWVPERHFDPFGAPYPSPAVLLAAIAARTRRIRLRAGSVVLPLRDPLIVAEEWGMLDALSGGRTGLSLASGWHADDFVLDPDSYERRKQVLAERLEILHRLWQGKTVSRPGPGGRVVEVRTYPQPQRLPAIWLTSSSNPATWRAAGEMNLHVLTALLEQSVEDLAEKAAIYRAALREAGHREDGRQITCMLHTHLAADADTAIERARPPLRNYLSAHLNLFERFAANQDIGVRPEDVTDSDRKALIDHGVQRYMRSSGLFGSVDGVRPVIERLTAAGVTELACLVDFGLPREHILDCVRELGELRARVA